jgi:hypothetical protein
MPYLRTARHVAACFALSARRAGADVDDERWPVGLSGGGEASLRTEKVFRFQLANSSLRME